MIVSALIPRLEVWIARSSGVSRTTLVVFLILLLSTGWQSRRAYSQELPPAASVEMEGVLEILHEDSDRGSRYHYFLKTGGDRVVLRFEEDPPTNLTSGALIRARGVRTDNVLALNSRGGKPVEVISSASSNSFGEQRTLVILVNFVDDASQPYTSDFANDVIFRETSDFFLENSYGQTWLQGDVAGWYTIPFTSTVCDIFSIADYAKQAAQAAGYNLSAYTRYVYAFPQNACGGLGLGTVGGVPSEAWIIGNLDLKTVSHELGHSFGLYHSHALECGNVVLGPQCSVFEYGDRIDTMGNIAAGHFNAFQKQLLGWLDYGISPSITKVQTSGLYTVEPLESLGSGAKGLAILKSTDPATGQQSWYYVEYRRALGFDSFLATNSNVLNGVLIHSGSPSDGNSSNLLDMTPASGSQNWSDWSDPALEAGRSYYDPDSGITIAAVSVSGTAAVVSVNFASQACVHANPIVTISPSQGPMVSAGTAVIYTVSLTNNDPSSCPASSFSLQATLPNGWSVVFASSTLSLNAGMTSSTALTVSSPASAKRGTYSFSVSATNTVASTSTASTTATYVIKRK